jgi:hypothetical protein
VRDETSAGEVGMVRVRVAAALLFVGGLVYAMLSGNWGTGAIAFSLGDRLGVAQRRSDRAVGWVLVLCGALTVIFVVIRIALGVT